MSVLVFISKERTLKDLKNRKICEMLWLSLLFSGTGIPAEGMSEINGQQNKKFEISQPLSEWPKVSLSTIEEKFCYDLNWDKKKALVENQRELMKNFMEICCDFSFQITEKNLSGVYAGKFDSGEDIVFVNDKTRIGVNYDTNKVTFFSENDAGKGLEVHPLTSLLLNVKPVDFQEWMKCEFERYIQRFVEDPIGCEVLRMSIAKYEAGQRGLSKIKFIPIDNEKMDLGYTSGSYVWKYVRQSGRQSFDIYEEPSEENKFIIFSPNWFNTDQRGLILKLGKTKSGADSFMINTGIMPREAGLMYQIIYATQSGKLNSYSGTQLIEKRDNQKCFRGNFEGVGSFSISKKRFNVSIFKNDRIYHVMYGLTKQGIDLVNESSYLAHKYKIIRPAYVGFKTNVNINGKLLDKKESIKFLKKFLRTNGDFDLYRYYLSPKSPIKYPEFGKGNYRCADINIKKVKTKRYIRK